MNWMKLRSSIIVIGTLFIINSPNYTYGRQLLYENDSLFNEKPKSFAKSILKTTINNLHRYDPSYYDSYSAITFNRFLIKANLLTKTDTLQIDNKESTINQNNIKPIFSTETLTFQKRLKPSYNQSEILSTKSEGEDNGSFSEFATSLNNISLLQSKINIFNKSYLSPFSKTYLRYYNYSSVDSILSTGSKLSKIFFWPKYQKQFNGFTGTAIINPKNSAIQSIKATSTPNFPQKVLIAINQNFELIEECSLPSEKKINVFLTNKNTNNQDNIFICESTTNIYQQQINPPLSPNDFIKPFSKQMVDSVIIADNLNRQMKMIRLMAEGKFPIGYFNLDYNRIIGYNIFEGIKLGLGGETNRLLSKHFTFGGYLSYGFEDRSVRHGEWLDVFPKSDSDFRIHLGYKDMNLEFGNPEFLKATSLLDPENYRTILTKNMFSTKRYTTGFEFRLLKELNLYFFGDLSENKSRQNTQFLLNHPFDPISLTRTGLQLRYSPGIKLQMEEGRLNEVSTPKADYYITIIRGLAILGGEYRYTKTEFKGKFDCLYSNIGTTAIMVRGGFMTINAPVIELFNGYGSFAGTFSLSAPYSFATMHLNEFAASNYTSAHLRHDFSPWLFSGNFKTKPALIFVQNIGFGWLNDQTMKQLNLNDYRKGFYESGFEVNNLLRMGYLSWGVGIYYRYGKYRLSPVHENFAFKFGFAFKL